MVCNKKCGVELPPELDLESPDYAISGRIEQIESDHQLSCPSAQRALAKLFNLANTKTQLAEYDGLLSAGVPKKVAMLLVRDNLHASAALDYAKQFSGSGIIAPDQGSKKLSAGNCLVLYGQSGSGKTVAAGFVVYQQLRRSHSAYVTTLPQLGSLVRSRQSIWAMYKAPLLVIDNIDQNTVTDAVAVREFEKLLHHRHDDNLSTVIATTLPPAEMEDIFSSYRRLTTGGSGGWAVGAGVDSEVHHAAGS